MKAENASRVVKYAFDNPLIFVDPDGQEVRTLGQVAKEQEEKRKRQVQRSTGKAGVAGGLGGQVALVDPTVPAAIPDRGSQEPRSHEEQLKLGRIEQAAEAKRRAIVVSEELGLESSGDPAIDAIQQQRKDVKAAFHTVGEIGTTVSATALSITAGTVEDVTVLATGKDLTEKEQSRLLAAGTLLIPGVSGSEVRAAKRLARAAGEISTAQNYARLFRKARPDLPAHFTVHHSLPQRYRELFSDQGIDINDLQFLRGIDPAIHSKITTEWGRFHKLHGGDPTAASIAEFAKKIDKKYEDYFVYAGR